MKIKYSYDKHEFKRWHLPFLILLILATIYVIRQNNPGSSSSDSWTSGNKQVKEGKIFGTFYHITYRSEVPLDSGIEQTLNQVDLSLSPFNPQSTITAINENTSTEADDMLIRVFNLARQVSEQTNRAFDITVAPLVNLWGFGFKNDSTIGQEAIDSIMQYVGMDGVTLENRQITKLHPESMLDCSAIAKGYGVDAVGEYLESQNVKDYMVEIGGEVRLRGKNPKGKDWTIGITKPEDDASCTQSDIQQIISVTDCSMATSGNYRNFYVKDGKKYAHTIDPHTGYPVQHSLLSSTVLATDCATADAYATAFMVMGMDSAKALLERHTELAAYFIYSTNDGKTAVWYSDRLKEMLDR